MEVSAFDALDKPKKRLFIGLLTSSVITMGAIFFLLWFIAFNKTLVLHKVLLVGLVITLILLFMLLSFGITGIVVSIWRHKNIVPFQATMRIAINVLFPIVMSIGHLLKIDKDKIKSSFIEVNNQLVKTKQVSIKPENIMILAPHCIQIHNCPHKITIDVENCKRCGKCTVNKLLDLKDKYSVEVAVATGGTLARKFIMEKAPKAIVAIACERDLTSGIQDTEALPVIGVLNERPNGPCFNTRVSANKVEEAIGFFLEGKYDEEKYDEAKCEQEKYTAEKKIS